MEKLTDYLVDAIGKVQSVDTKKIIVEVDNEEILNKLKINDIIIMSGNNADEKLIGIIIRVNKKKIEIEDSKEDDEKTESINSCRITLVGSFYIKVGANRKNVFKRAINTYPAINSEAYLADNQTLAIIMNSLDESTGKAEKLITGKNETRHPLAFICDEAHIYMANDLNRMRSVERRSLEIFEKISKEGRKYGISLVIVSQRPAELNTTIVSQCNNIISLKVTNERDKSAVSAMMTDSLVGLVDMLPNLDVGECIVVGDAIKLPTKILLDKPKEEPKSSTIDFWDRWNDKENTIYDLDGAVLNMVRQSRI